jgi:GT2 family glycosyltransferase
MRLTFDDTLGRTLEHRSNAYDHRVREFEERTGHRWDDPTPGRLGRGQVSVVIPARDMAYSLPAVLDALGVQEAEAGLEVIVVDDGSADETAAVAAGHPIRPILVRVPAPAGAGTARNLGVAIASGETVLFADADMILPPHAVADVTARARDDLILIGFRHNVPYQPGPAEPLVPAWPADLAADHRVRWRAPAGRRLLYTGITLDRPADSRPLEATGGFRQLGHGRRYYDWDLPRMVVTALLAVPRAAFLDAGGFDARFGAIGWGCEDTYLGAALIGLGLMVAPLPQLVGYHVNPPDEASSWNAKLATWPDTVALYRHLLTQPPPHGLAARFRAETSRILQGCEVTR